MRSPAVLLAVMLIVAAGCSKPSHYWYQPGRSFEQARQDCCVCTRYARREASEAVADEYLDRAYTTRGGPRYYGTPDDDASFTDGGPIDAWLAWGQVYQANVFDGCMKRHGYTRVKAHRLPTGLRTGKCSLGTVAGR